MENSSKNKQKQAVDSASCSGSKPAGRPHWRRRDPADTAVYVVQPDQFRAVVQQLTGAASSPPPAHHHHQGCHGTAAAAEPQHQHQAAAAGTIVTNAAPQQQQHQADAGTITNAVPPRQQHGGGTSSGRTLGQIQQECMAWANSNDE